MAKSNEKKPDAGPETPPDLDALRAENEALTAELETVRAQRAEADRAAQDRVKQLEGEIGRLRGELTRIGDEVERREKLRAVQAPVPPAANSHLQAELERVRAEVVGYKAELAKLKAAAATAKAVVQAPVPHPRPATQPPPPATPGMRRARVTIPGTHVGAIYCEIPADSPPERAHVLAVSAAADARGIARNDKGMPMFAAAPVVEFID